MKLSTRFVQFVLLLFEDLLLPLRQRKHGVFCFDWLSMATSDHHVFGVDRETVIDNLREIMFDRFQSVFVCWTKTILYFIIVNQFQPRWGTTGSLVCFPSRRWGSSSRGSWMPVSSTSLHCQPTLRMIMDYAARCLSHVLDRWVQLIG